MDIKSAHTKFRLLQEEYFNRASHLVEVEKKTTRGHGILLVDMDDLILATPLRSNMSAKRYKSDGFLTYKTHQVIDTDHQGNPKVNETGEPILKEVLIGLDISKTLFVQASDINESSPYQFQDPEEEKYYQQHFAQIKRRVKSYINNYKKLCADIKSGKNIKHYRVKEYKYTTLQNYHDILDIALTAEEYKNFLIQKQFITAPA